MQKLYNQRGKMREISPNDIYNAVYDGILDYCRSMGYSAEISMVQCLAHSKKSFYKDNRSFSPQKPDPLFGLADNIRRLTAIVDMLETQINEPADTRLPRISVSINHASGGCTSYTSR